MQTVNIKIPSGWQHYAVSRFLLYLVTFAEAYDF